MSAILAILAILAIAPMDYREQQQYLQRSRWLGALVVLALLGVSFTCVAVTAPQSVAKIVVFAVVGAALAASICYAPNYLHLTVSPQKRSKWAIKIRWRTAAAVLILGMGLSGSWSSRVVVLIAVAWLVAVNLAAKTCLPERYVASFLSAGEFALMAALVFRGPLDLMLGAVLLAAEAHLLIVSSDRYPFRWAALSIFSACAVIWFSLDRHSAFGNVYAALAGLILVTGLATAFLVDRAQEQNARNLAAAITELEDFTGYSEDRIRHLWAVSNQELAKNWQNAAIPQDDRERLAQWYRDNSELYLFAISGYNLEYKRIRSNLGVLKFARGACLDYGAGNGEIILELARRGHPVTYYDVDGATMKFARRRAERGQLPVEFVHLKDDLAALARKRSFDTIFSFDVLEHLPDLPGELTLLSSMLSPGGVFVFDVPAGSTKAHPMHLNHSLDVFAFMQAKGFRDERGLALRLPLKKEEKYVYRKPQASSGGSV